VVATNDPVSSVKFFKIIVDAFIEKIAKIGDYKGGIFEPCNLYFATMETTGWGILHLHCLVWITGNVGIQNLWDCIAKDAEFAALIIKYMEDITWQSLSIIEDKEEESSMELLLKKKVNSEIM